MSADASGVEDDSEQEFEVGRQGRLDVVDRETRYAEAIWNASRADEGSISATGANLIARAVMDLVRADLRHAELALVASRANSVEWMARAEAAEATLLRGQAGYPVDARHDVPVGGE